MQTTAEIVHLISEIAVLLGIIVPLLFALIRFIKKSIKEKNWTKLLDLAMTLMEQAEKEFQNGSDRKSFVMQMLRASMDEIDYDISDEELSDLIDSLVGLTNKLNIKK